MELTAIISRNLPFVLYRLPGADETTLMVQKNKNVRRISIEQIEAENGFVIVPFEGGGKNVRLLVPDLIFKSSSEDILLSDFLKDIPYDTPEFPKIEDKNYTREEYMETVQYILTEMENGKIDKVVLSRVITTPVSEEIDLYTFFDRLQKKYTSAFVYMFYLPGDGIWAGATPETLLKKSSLFLETMALAGTKKLTRNGNINWGDKEIREQQFVTYYIDDILKTLKVNNYEKSKAETIKAGNLAHICTHFRVKENALKGHVGDFIRMLHPTPAVCGLPKESALKYIRQKEKHQRSFYTGFIGPWGIDSRKELFVNLRCGRFSPGFLEVYVGGGLTIDSNPEKEWQETCDKSRTLLSVLEKM